MFQASPTNWPSMELFISQTYFPPSFYQPISQSHCLLGHLSFKAWAIFNFVFLSIHYNQCHQVLPLILPKWFSKHPSLLLPLPEWALLTLRLNSYNCCLTGLPASTPGTYNAIHYTLAGVATPDSRSDISCICLSSKWQLAAKQPCWEFLNHPGACSDDLWTQDSWEREPENLHR
jgi:hypothetical protein